ncbi:MAG: protein-disulfide reductase DsbD [Pseudomonadota bacterium]|nr:protein-disulfide reductase DsbD [Pseudomonadota bacterium]MDP2353617.1 protein-disulfide reductase DsbD [Pseudomonadota bacterium]
MRFLFALLCLFASFAYAEEELLEPEKAFIYSASLADAGSAEISFQIAKGYYLYKNKLKFSADAGVKLGTPALPAGKVKQDEYFGRVETYRGELRFRIPVTYPDGTPKAFNLKTEFQGCADVGVCYPPQEGVAALKPAAPSRSLTAPIQQQSSAALARLKAMAGSLMGGDEPEYLSPEEAFKMELKARPDGSLEAHYLIAKGHYLYRDKLKITVTQPGGAKVASMALPPAEVKDDPNFGRMLTYHQSFTSVVKLAGLPAGSSKLKLTAVYQGCSDKGICYPPQEQDFSLTVKLAAAIPALADDPAPEAAVDADASAPASATEAETGAATASVPGPAPTTAAAPETSDTGKVEAILQGGNYWVVVASFFGFGLLLSLTPCVFPMIPILSGIIVGQGAGITKRKGFMLSLAYVLGMAMTYAMAGVAAGLSGTLISNALQNPWALSTGAGIFVALALSMFGFYELQLPSFVQSRFTEASNRIKGGHFAGVFLMGVLSALIVGPCVAAPLAGALLYISQTGDVVLGGVSLFSLAMGMGVPLLLVGLSAGALLPRAGAWMEAVKKFFGVALLAVAIWLISPLLSDIVQMFMWAALLMISGIYLKATEHLAVNASGWTRFWKGVGLISLVVGIAVLLGALGGGRDILQPLAVYKGGVAGAAETSPHLAFQRVKNNSELDAAIKGAGGRAVMLDFYADWCVSCKEMERFTFADAKVQARLKDVLLLQADVTANSAEDKALLARFKLFGPPGIIFWDKSGQEMAYHVIGYEPAEKFLRSIDKALP